MGHASLVDRERAVQVTVFVERLDDQTYRAETTQPIVLVTKGRTRDEAIERLRMLAQQRLIAGEMVRREIPEIAAPHPWAPCVGIRKDHPDLDPMLEHIAEERRQGDAAESGA